MIFQKVWYITDSDSSEELADIAGHVIPGNKKKNEARERI